jgi:predicted HTH transcriptional regulator
MHLEDLLTRPEGKTLEFKGELVSAEPFLKTVVAFANTAGGVVVFGVEDRTRRVLGVADPLALEGDLTNLVSDAIRPRLLPDIEILPWRKTYLVAVQIYPSPSRPHYLKSLGLEQGVFVRVGSSNRRADRVMLEELRRLAQSAGFDEQPLVELDSEALDFRAASEFFAPVRRLTPRDLLILGMAVEYQGQIRPTTGGMLLFGKDRPRWFPDAYLQVGRFRGTDRTEILDTAEIRSHLPQAVEQALDFVRQQESKGIEIHGARHEEQWSVPLVAVREAIINAVVHADYAQRGAPIRVSVFEDRLEVENPGLLPFGLTLEDILRGVSKLRNRVLGRVFKELGLIEQWGSGIGRMLSACREAGLPEPRFEEVGWHFRVTLSKERTQRKSADPVEQALLQFLSDGAGHTTAEIAQAIQRSPRATRTRLAGLVARGAVVEVGRGPQDPKRQYYLAP